MMPFTSSVFPFTYGSWDEGPGYHWMQFNNVEFFEDFGSVRRGTRFPVIKVDLARGDLYLPDGSKIRWKAASLKS